MTVTDDELRAALNRAIDDDWLEALAEADRLEKADRQGRR